MNVVQTVESRLAQWQALHDLGKRQGTVKFHKEVLASFRTHFDCSQLVESVTDQAVQEFAVKVSHFCPSRWNALVTVLRFVTPLAQQLKRRKLRFRDFIPPTASQFAALLAELDKLPQSRAGLVVRLLSLTGLRICEARRLRWEHVQADRIEVNAMVSKNGRARCVPFVSGTAEVLQRLRALPGASGLVLTRPNIRTGLAKACQRAGVKFMSYHCFRHLFATRCIESGVDMPTVARWLGHQDGGALLSKMYFHLLDDHSRAMAARVKI
jgi:integrase